MTKLSGPVVALVFLALPVQGLSVESDNDLSTSKATTLDTMTVTASRRERPLREVANSITVIDAEGVQEALVADMKDLARYKPWLSVGNDPSRFGLSGFSIRGLGANRVVTEIDGVPVANGFSVGNYSSSGRDAINPAMAKRVEILRGPASALYGSDAMGGVISYRTFEPEDFLLGNDKEHYLGTTTGYDARDNSLAASFTAASNLGKVSLLLAATSRFGHESDNRAFTNAGRSGTLFARSTEAAPSCGRSASGTSTPSESATLPNGCVASVERLATPAERVSPGRSSSAASRCGSPT